MATVSLGGPLDEKLDAIATAGFDGVELLAQDVAEFPGGPAEIADICRGRDLSVDVYQPFRRAEGVSEQEFDDTLVRFRRELDVMETLGCRSILVVSNTDPNADPDPDVSASQLQRLAAEAAARGMDVLFEALSWGTHINRLTEATEVAARAGHPSLTVVVDTFHLHALGDGAESVRSLPPSAVGFVQVADAPLLEMDLLTWSRHHRRLPGEGDFPLAETTEALRANGYDGVFSLELFGPSFQKRPAHEVAQSGADALRELLSTR